MSDKTTTVELLPNEDHMFDILLLAARGAEEEARDAYGDRAVDTAIDRVLREEGWQ